MSKEMVISANPHETRVAILEEGQLCEYYVEREKEFALVGSIYKGKVTRVLPGMQSAFVEIGLDSDAFLYVSDFMEEIEELDHVVTTVEDKAQKMEEQGGQVFPANTGTTPIIEPMDVESPRASAGAAPGVAAGLEPLPGESISALRGPSVPGTFSPAVSRPSQKRLGVPLPPADRAPPREAHSDSHSTSAAKSRWSARQASIPSR